MKRSEFFNLAEKVISQQTVEPTKDSALKKAVRAPGDIGKVERLQQMHKNKGGAKMTRVPDVAQRVASAVELGPDKMAAADKILQDVSGVKSSERKKGSVRTPVNFNDPEQYRRKVASLSGKMNGRSTDKDDELEADPEKVDKGPAPKFPGGPPRGWTMTSKDPKHQEYTQQLKDYKAFKDAGGEAEQEARSPEDTVKGMENSKLYGKDATTQADKDFDDVIQQSASPNARKGVEIPGVGLQKDSRTYNHAYQPSGVGVLSKTEYDDEYQDALLGGILDPDRMSDGKDDSILGNYDYDKMSEIPIYQNAGEDNDLKNFDPSPRDLETVTQRGEDIGKEKGKSYLTPEVLEKQKQLRDALVGQQSDKVQELAFKFDISDEQLDGFIDQFQQGAPERRASKKKLMAKLEGAGVGDGRGFAYGGDLGDIPDEARLGPDGEKLPDGVYNTSKLDPIQKKKAQENRARELIRTYLKQGGQNAYAPHEGLRSVLQMDLEHIKSLKAGGHDHPDNWVWASQNLNRMRGNKDLGPEAERYVDDKGIRQGADKLSQGVQFTDTKGMADIFGGDKEKQKAFTDEFGEPGGRGQKKGMFNRDDYHKMSQADIDQVRMQAQRNYGLSDEQAQTIFPDEPRIAGRSYEEDPDGYARDYETNLSDQSIYRSGMQKIKGALEKKLQRTINNDEIKNSDEGKEFLDNFKKLGKNIPDDEAEIDDDDEI